MRYIQKFFKSKKSVEEYIEEKGMEEAVKEYGLNKLVMYKLLFQYEGTNLYYDDNFSVITKVYNEGGEFLGYITPLMSPYYKKLGYYFGPCKNGNIVLSQSNENRQGRTYGVFDKKGNQIIGFGKFPEFCFLPNGIALMNESGEYNAVTVHYDGTVKTQPFLYFDTDGATGNYILYKKHGDEVVTYDATAKVINDLTDSSTEMGTIEKGIE